ncbi:YXWGXW repeat-containing protein [Massilia sp. 2TAF26]|uniref:YXWGXW repeat-containing protein n=1 Tax=Massilia sp. 2TAF26 TaxID=3233012 RepID=UPI003F9AD997
MKRTLALAALIFAGAAAAPLPSLAASNVSLYIGTAPPAPVYERIPAPRHGYVWAPGYWNWAGHRHVWVPGNWVVERPGYVYNAPVWTQGGGGWYMQPARWTQYGGYDRGYRDRDRDGIPDRYEVRRGWDRDRDGIPDRYEHGRRDGRWDQDRDGIPNRYDRDGDGVPNRYDRRPDNPWRR